MKIRWRGIGLKILKKKERKNVNKFVGRGWFENFEKKKKEKINSLEEGWFENFEKKKKKEEM